MTRAKHNLGLEYGTVQLAQDHDSWLVEARRMAKDLRTILGGFAGEIEHVGSTAVPQLPAKPILDFAVRLAVRADPAEATLRLDQAGYIYRADAGAEGGLVFVRETAPQYRVAHLHVLAHDDPQWSRYLQFRDLLCTDAEIRSRYADLKRELADRFPDDRRGYTTGKAAFIREALAAHDATSFARVEGHS